MKKTVSRIFLFLPVMVLVYSCAGFQNNRLGTLAAKLQFETGLATSKALPSGGVREARSITPSENWYPTRYVVSGSGPGGAEFSLESTNQSIETKLVPGDWTIEVHAFSPGNKEVATGTTSCRLQPGMKTSAKITIYPIEGMGDITLTITTNLTLPPGGRVKGSLKHKGLPGHPAPSEQTILPIDIPTEQTSLSFTGIPAGHYSLTLQMVDSDGNVSGGCAETVMVMAGFTSAGNCAIELGIPSGDFLTEFFPSSPLTPPLMSVRHKISDSRALLPLAIPRYKAEPGEIMTRKWYLNGEEAGDAIRLTGNLGILPEGTLAYPQNVIPMTVSMMRADLLEESGRNFRTGSASVMFEAGPCNDLEYCGWRASYNYISALSPPLYELFSPNDNGTGTAYSARAVAASPSGLIVVSGLDEEAAIHAFAAGYGADLDPLAAAGISKLPIDTSWIRLWRDRTKIGTSYKSADRLAISNDGQYFAAASSASDWLRLSCLDANGKLLRSFFLTATVDGELKDFKNIRALCFSADGEKLYVAANSKGTVYAFDVNENGISFASSLQISRPEGATSLSLQDIKVTSTGTILVTASESSRIHLLMDGTTLSETGYMQGASGGTDPYKPSSLAISADDDAFYVLCDGKRILCYSRENNLSSYVQESTFELPEEVVGSTFIAAGKALTSGVETVFAAGGDNVAFFEIGADRTVIDSHSIFSVSWDIAGIATTSGLSFARGAFILSGGSSGIVSVFGAD